MRIVFVCQWNPWALNGGALIRNAWLIRALGTRYHVDLVTADDPSGAVPAEFAEACASIWRFPCGAGSARRIERAVSALRPRASFFTSGNTGAALRRKVRELMAAGDAVAMIDLKMIDALPERRPFVYNAHNAEHQLFRRRADYERGAARHFMRVEAARVARIEAKAVRGAALVAACSENDRQELAELVPQSSPKIVVVPNGVDTRHYAPIAVIAGEPRTILITGSYDWRPNLIGLEWFLDEILPALRTRMPDGNYTIRIAGRMKPELAARLNHFPGVCAIPNPPTMTNELARARIVVAPILASSGTRLRILEAWAAGRPVVTTGAGALGLTARNEEELLLAEEPAAFADAIARVLADDDLWKHVRDCAYVRARSYDWEQIGAHFLEQAAPVFASLQRDSLLIKSK